MPPSGLLPLLPVLVLTGVTLSALGMFLSSRIRQLENFAGVMNFLIFPMFFMSSALYPLWRVREGSVLLAELCQHNPFTRSEDRRVGKAGVSTGRSRWSPFHQKKKYYQQ